MSKTNQDNEWVKKTIVKINYAKFYATGEPFYILQKQSKQTNKERKTNLFNRWAMVCWQLAIICLLLKWQLTTMISHSWLMLKRWSEHKHPLAEEKKRTIWNFFVPISLTSAAHWMILSFISDDYESGHYQNTYGHNTYVHNTYCRYYECCL